MSDEINVKYKSEEIIFSESREVWRWSGYENASLGKVKAHIDRAYKQEFQRVPAIKMARWADTYERVEVTSRTEKDDYWVKNSKGKREKATADALYADTPDNARKLAELDALDAQIVALRASKDALRKSLTRFTVKVAPANKRDSDLSQEDAVSSSL